ncbi:MAG TPA: YeeE/YedE thiosulfate transporter family protein [Cytophagaceae bacterium]|jgi:hypothetical protein|nr:YeeE/YedE thiosulfate transporter family protein [Cytophagaceae bacterium]
MLELIQKPWPWYISGPLIGLMVPALLLLGNKSFGLSSSLKHICAMCTPMKVDFFEYDWKKEIWNLVLVTGILLGGWIAATFLNPTVEISDATIHDMHRLGIQDTTGMNPAELFNWSALTTWQGFTLIIIGGFLVGFGTRYADGCTSGHAIMGLSIMNWPSLIAVAGFFAGGLLMTHLILPFILY